MGAKDTKAKEYLSDNWRFADLCNTVLFDGAQKIKAEELQERDTAEILSVLGTEGNEVQLQRTRDLLKQVVIKSCGNTYIMLIGIEAQADVHYAMPVKVMTYDALNYGAQVKEAARAHREAGDHGTGAEFLSGFHKNDRITPVITITVYLGAEPWDGPRKLSDMFREPDGWLEALAPDYKIHLVVPQEIEDFGKFQTSLGEVLEIIKVSEDKEAMKKLLATNPQYRTMDNETVLAINTFIGLNIPVNEEGSETDMCKAFEDIKAEEREEGREEGRGGLISNMLSLGRTSEEIASFAGITLAEVLKVEKSMH